jgi:hypothetical protein
VVIRVIVQDVHHVRVFISRHVLTTRAVSIVEKVKTRVVSVPRVLAQACRAVLHNNPGNTVSHAVAAIVLVPVIIREKKVVTSLVAAISPVVATSPVPKENMVSRVAAISLVSRAAISLVALISPVLSMASRVRENRENTVSLVAAISPVVATSLVAVISLVSRVVTSRVVAISLVSRGAMLPSVVVMVPSVAALRSSVVPMTPMQSIR